jgi:hypothetical protein
MPIAPLTPKAIVIILILGSLMVIDHSCSGEDLSISAARSRHEAAMKDLGKNDHVPVRVPW